MTTFIGQITLNLSLLLYFIWFIPQIRLTFQRRSTAGISLGMHSLLVIGYIADLIYGFGRHLPLQYKLVTLFGLSMLALEQGQMGYYGNYQHKEKIGFYGLTLLFTVLLLAAIYHFTMVIHSKEFYNNIGWLSWVCWLAFLWPQLLKNSLQRSTLGVSPSTMVLSLFSSILDIISAFTLGWDWPSKIGSSIGLIPKLLILLQHHYYKNEALGEHAHGI